MSLRTNRRLGLAAWVGFLVFVYVGAPSTVRGASLLASMLAWSLVGVTFGVSWFAARNWVESKMPPDDAHAVRRFKLAQFGLWMGTVLAFVWVTQVTGTRDDAVVMGIVTLAIAPIWLGVDNLLAPRSAQSSP